MKRGRCKACGARIVWIQTPAGKTMPCNADPVMYKARVGATGKIVTANGHVINCDLNVGADEATGIGYVSHFATCPMADLFRRGKG